MKLSFVLLLSSSLLCMGQRGTLGGGGSIGGTGVSVIGTSGVFTATSPLAIVGTDVRTTLKQNSITIQSAGPSYTITNTVSFTNNVSVGGVLSSTSFVPVDSDSLFTFTFGDGGMLIVNSGLSEIDGSSVHIHGDNEVTVGVANDTAPINLNTGNIKVSQGSSPTGNLTDIIASTGNTNTWVDVNGMLASLQFFMPSNNVSLWPTSSPTKNGSVFVKSNNVVYILTTGLNSTSWAATNKLAP